MERFETGHAERLIPMIARSDAKERVSASISSRSHRGDDRPRHVHGHAHRRRRSARLGAGLEGQDRRCLEPRRDGRGCRAGDHMPMRWLSSSMRGAARSTRSCSVPGCAWMRGRRRSCCRSRKRRIWVAAVLSSSSARAPLPLLKWQRAKVAMRPRVCSTSCPMPAPWRVSADALEASDAPLVPFYLRPPDAKPQDGKAIARA